MILNLYREIKSLFFRRMKILQHCYPLEVWKSETEKHKPGTRLYFKRGSGLNQDNYKIVAIVYR